jgi:nucleotide-binding universal stress UspA family protein
MASPPILVATDLSEPANDAIRQGSEQAQLRRAELIVCHVVPSLVRSHMLFPQQIAREAMEQSRVEARVAQLVRDRTCAVTGRAPGDFQVVVAEGAPYDEIMRSAEALGAGLIVVGSHGHSGLASVFLGDVAERIVRDARVPVLLARPRERTGQLVVATDLSDAAYAALAAAAQQARLTGARLTLMSSIHERLEPILAMTTFGSDYRFVDAECQELRERTEGELAALLVRAGVSGETLVTTGDAAAEIVHLAAERRAELLFIGAVGHGAHRRHGLGKVAERVTRHAPCPVLVVRPPGGRA